MEVKMITVRKGSVTKKVEASLEKQYAKNGWKVVNENPYEQTNFSSFVSKK